MSLGQFALAAASISQTQSGDGGKKVPSKRSTVALSDRKAVPEPR
jgi:hypothetical protein